MGLKFSLRMCSPASKQAGQWKPRSPHVQTTSKRIFCNNPTRCKEHNNMQPEPLHRTHTHTKSTLLVWDMITCCCFCLASAVGVVIEVYLEREFGPRGVKEYAMIHVTLRGRRLWVGCSVLSLAFLGLKTRFSHLLTISQQALKVVEFPASLHGSSQM